MAYISKYSGEEIDNAIIVNENQNNRLTSIENNISSLEESIRNSMTNTINNLQNTIMNIQNQINNIHIPDIKLNYSIIGGTTKPSNPTENLIWINTSNNITSTIFSSATPLYQTEGMIWVITGPTGKAGFDMLNIDNISMDKIYPIGVKQYISGVWVQKIGQIYLNNQWIPFETTLIWNGQYQTPNTLIAYGYGEIRQVNGFIRSYMPQNEYATYEFGSQIDTRNYSKVSITINGGSNNYSIWFGFSKTKGKVPTNVNTNVFEIASVSIPRSGTTVTAGTYTIDLTNINENLWFGFLTSGSSSSKTSTYGYGGIDIISIVFE